MARPAKSTKAKTAKISKAETAFRAEIESKISGNGDIVAPSYLTESQLNIFNFIKSVFDESKMMGQLDCFVLSKAAVTIDQLQDLDKKANNNPELLFDTGYIRAISQLTKDFFRLCNELCLSPQARAKLSISAVKAQEPKKKTLMDIINEEDD